jgi:hypothetical protein
MATASSVAPDNKPAAQRLTVKDACLTIQPELYRTSYNKASFAFSHNLHLLDCFQFGSLCELVERYVGFKGDYYVAPSAAAPGSAFFDGPKIELNPKEAIQELDRQPIRILLKRLENHDDRFRELVEVLIRQLRTLPGGLGSKPVLRIQSSLFISSAAATTPLHFDPEVAFFTQIEGDKTYHVYSPDDVSEEDLEYFYARGQIEIGQLELTKRNPEKQHIYNLEAGDGFHQPQNSPHWVETCGTRSISYSCVFETDADLSLGRIRGFNRYQRKLGGNPAPPGLHPHLDSLKAKAMIANRLARRIAGKIIR